MNTLTKLRHVAHLQNTSPTHRNSWQLFILFSFVALSQLGSYIKAAPIQTHDDTLLEPGRIRLNQTFSRTLYEENPKGDRCHPDRYGAKYIPPVDVKPNTLGSTVSCHVNIKLYSPDIEKNPWYVDPTCSLTMPDSCETAPSYFLNNENDEENKEIKCQPVCPRFFPPYGCAPSTFVIGAHRAAISILHRFFDIHPDFCSSPLREDHKYSNFSKVHRQTRMKKYVSKFPAQKNCLTGDFAPMYLYSPVVAKRMLEDWPEARIIILLRNPTRRALSHYKQVQSRLVSKAQKERFGTFSEEIAKNMKAGESHHFDTKQGTLDIQEFMGQRQNPFLERGMYADFLTMWMRIFPSNQIFVTTYEDLTNPRMQSCVLKNMFRFVGLRTAELNRAYRLILPPKGGEMEEFAEDKSIFKDLDNFYRPFNRRLEAMLGRSLGYPV